MATGITGILKKAIAWIAALAVAACMMPVVPAAWAGGGHSIDWMLKGLNSDGKVDVGSTVYVTMADLETEFGDFPALYTAGTAHASWNVGTDFGDSTVVSTALKDGKFSYTVKEADAGKFIWFDTDGPDSDYNNNSGQHEINTPDFKPVSIKAPKITKFSVSTSVLYATCTVKFERGKVDSGSGYAYPADSTYVELYKNGKLVNKKAVDDYYSSSTVIGAKIRYAKKDKLYVKVYNMYNGKKLGTPAKSKTISKKSKALGKAKNVRATRISSKKAIVRWSQVSGATGYRIYKGSKKVKQVKGNVFKATIKASGAGKAKYRIMPILKSKLDKKTFKGEKSKAAKPKKNQVKFNVSTKYKSYKYMTCPFVIKKISLSGKTYTITGYACNNRIWTMKKYSKLSINVFADGKQVVKKTLKNKHIGVKDSSSKKIVIKVKGKAGADLANGENVHRYTSVESYWVFSNGKQVK